MRQRFYHGTVPEAEFAQYRREVADELVEKELMVQEALRRGLKPDQKKIEQLIAGMEEENKDNKQWQEHHDSILAMMQRQYEGDSLFEQLKDVQRNTPEPTDKEVAAYYKEHPELFTTPSRNHVYLILLKVDPSSPSEKWTQAEEQVAQLVNQLREGADFAEIARIHSGDDSAQNGGDMGFIHQGMLGGTAQQMLDLMVPGDISEPVLLLEGAAVFKLVERSETALNPFESVKNRAKSLLDRERKKMAWEGLIARLKEKAEIKWNEKIMNL
jgi:parvulin-like peptidyl-prolyl isomerase